MSETPTREGDHAFRKEPDEEGKRRLADFRRKLVRRLACHGLFLSGVEASGKPGAVQRVMSPRC